MSTQTYFQTPDGKQFHFPLKSEREDALRAAIEHAGEGGKVEVRARDRMNDYVGSPIWGNDRHVGYIQRGNR